MLIQQLVNGLTLGAVYTLIATTPAAEAFRPLSEGGCPLVKA